MRIVVCSRQVYSVDDEIELNDAGTDVDPDFRDTGISEWDQAALEAALRLKDEGAATEVIALSVAGEEADPILRRLLAMGADRARRVELDSELVGNPIGTARVLAEAIQSESPDLVLMGVQTADQSNGATSAALAGILDWPSLAVVKEFALEGSAVRAKCELEGGSAAEFTATLPAVMSVQTGHYLPRYANLRAIKQADAKELTVTTASAPEGKQKLRKMYVPQSDNQVELLGEDPADVAARIIDIVKEAQA